jgi:hypothetical protein
LSLRPFVPSSLCPFVPWSLGVPEKQITNNSPAPPLPEAAQHLTSDIYHLTSDF